MPETPPPADQLDDILVLHRRGDLVAAQAGYWALWQRDRNLNALHLLGVVYRQKGDAAAAVQLIGTALEQCPPPGPALWWYHLALGFNDLGDSETARCAFTAAAELAPGHLEIALCAAQADLDAGAYQLCAERLQAALARYPNHCELLFLRAKLALAQGEAAACFATCQAALAIDPDHAGLQHLAGQALFTQTQPQAAIPFLERALALDGALAEAWNDLGLCRRGFDDSIAHFRKALALRPGFALAEVNLAHALLLAGDYRAGFHHYEARLSGKNLRARPFAAPTWQGEKLAAHRTLLLHGEQGVGDTVQMLRFIRPAFELAGSRLVVEVPDLLSSVVKFNLPADIAVVSRLDEEGSNLPFFDCHLPLMSLPNRLKLERNHLEGAPYLVAPPHSSLTGPSLTAGLPKGRCCFGLVWAGNPEFPLDRLRSVQLEDIAPLFDLPGICWVSLQKGAQGARLAQSGYEHILNLAEDLTDFADTAAVIAELDGVVAVDTGVAHLAAALGCPTWIALPAYPEWRWGRSGVFTPWYRSARLIRRGPAGISGQMAELASDILAWINSAWLHKRENS